MVTKKIAAPKKPRPLKVIKSTKRIVLEWTEINGKKFPKRVIDIVPKEQLPKGNKSNGELIDNIFENGN